MSDFKWKKLSDTVGNPPRVIEVVMSENVTNHRYTTIATCDELGLECSYASMGENPNNVVLAKAKIEAQILSTITNFDSERFEIKYSDRKQCCNCT